MIRTLPFQFTLYFISMKCSRTDGIFDFTRRMAVSTYKFDRCSQQYKIHQYSSRNPNLLICYLSKQYLYKPLISSQTLSLTQHPLSPAQPHPRPPHPLRHHDSPSARFPQGITSPIPYTILGVFTLLAPTSSKVSPLQAAKSTQASSFYQHPLLSRIHLCWTSFWGYFTDVY